MRLCSERYCYSGLTAACWLLFLQRICSGFVLTSIWQASTSASHRDNCDLMASASIMVEESQVSLDTGIEAQVLSMKPEKLKKTDLPPLVFLHGSFHAAWCWSEHYFPYFTSLGYTVAALSWRGTGRTFAGEGVKKVKVDEHAADLQSFLRKVVPEICDRTTNRKPVLVAHSFGGLAVMKHLEQHPQDIESIGGIVMMCSVPPSGNFRLTLRYLRRSLVTSYKITAGFAARKCIKNEVLCRELFFGGPKILDDGTGAVKEDYGLTDDDIRRYQSYFARDTVAVIDLSHLARNLPSSKADKDGKSTQVENLPPCLVVGASRDFIVDQVANEETAVFFGADSPTIVDSPHDVMLGANWKNGAEVIDKFVKETLL